jgi:hypothetical protein
MKTSSITRALAPAALAAAALVAPAQPALAAPAVPEPIEVDYTAPCPGSPDNFLSFTAVGKVGEITLPGGRKIYTAPGLRVTVTGPTGDSRTYIATGATKTQKLDGGNVLFTATGTNIITVPDINGHPAGVYYTAGTFNWILDANGDEVGDKFTGKGKVTDLCQLLAPVR